MFRDDFFAHRVGSHQVDTSRFEATESAHLIDHRWWTLADLAVTTDQVLPWGLAPLMGELLSGRGPDQPVELPWHHWVRERRAPGDLGAAPS